MDGNGHFFSIRKNVGKGNRTLVCKQCHCECEPGRGKVFCSPACGTAFRLAQPRKTDPVTRKALHKVCAKCGAQFKASMRGKLCPEHRPKRTREIMNPAAREMRAAMRAVMWKPLGGTYARLAA